MLKLSFEVLVSFLMVHYGSSVAPVCRFMHMGASDETFAISGISRLYRHVTQSCTSVTKNTQFIMRTAGKYSLLRFIFRLKLLYPAFSHFSKPPFIALRACSLNLLHGIVQ